MLPAGLPFPDIGTDLFSFDIGGVTFALRWYALAYIFGILIGWRICSSAISRPALWTSAGPPLDRTQIEDLLTWIIIGVIAGGRLGFVLFYQPAYYLANPLEILMVWQGGMSFHGGSRALSSLPCCSAFDRTRLCSALATCWLWQHHQACFLEGWRTSPTMSCGGVQRTFPGR